MILLIGKYNNTNVIEYSIIKSRRVVRLVPGAEKIALADACNDELLIQHDLKHILKKTIIITVLTDCATLFNVMIRNTSTTEKDNDGYKGSNSSL